MKIAMLALLAVVPMFGVWSSTTKADATFPEDERVIVDFSAKNAKAWRSLNDGVMGGVSEGSARIVKGRMLFEGETRLENNGGFSSVRSVPAEWDLDGATNLSVRLRGDVDRKYTMIIEAGVNGQSRRITYWRAFSLKGEGWQTVSMPLSEFGPVFRGQKLRGPELEPENIRSLGVMVYDKKAGPFRLEMAWVKAGFKSAVKLAKSKTQDSDTPNLVELAQGAGKFNTLLTAATKAGLVDTLTGKGPYTVLAPTDAAFAVLPQGTVATLIKPENRDKLKNILLYHVIPGRLSAADLLKMGKVAAAQGQDLSFRIDGGRLKVGDAGIILNDLAASNGVVHAIDAVLLPADPLNAVQRVLARAAEIGAPLYNDGEVKACRGVYEMAVTSVVELSGDQIDATSRGVLSEALEKSSAMNDDKEAAWTLRRAMDVVYASY